MDSSITRRTLLKSSLSAAAAGLTLPTLAAATEVASTATEVASTATEVASTATEVASTAPQRTSSRAPGDVIGTLTAYMKDAQTRPLPPEPMEHTKLHTLDTFAA